MKFIVASFVATTSHIGNGSSIIISIQTHGKMKEFSRKNEPTKDYGLAWVGKGNGLVMY